MKKCPQCGREYDLTMSYCLDDGSELLYGPRSEPPALAGGQFDSEPATAILSGVPSSEAATRAQINPTGATAVFPTEGESGVAGRRPGKRVFVILGVALAALVVGAAGIGIYKFSGSKATYISFESAKITRLTNSGKVANKTAISPDGKWLVYANQDGEQQSLWLKQVALPDSNTQIAPPTTLQYRGLAFSPDGNYIYYTAFEPGAATGTLFQVPVLGGTARKLFTGIWDKISFSPDGKQIAYFNYIDDEDRLMIANADGTEQRQLAVRKGNEFFVSGTQVAAWSPDGKTIATTVGTTNPRKMSIAAVSVATGEIDLFSSQKFDWAGDPLWLADGKSVLFRANEIKFLQQKIWQVSYPSGEAKKISNDLNSYSAISLTADSNDLATVQADAKANIWTVPINDPARATQATSGIDNNNTPSWTPDGQLVYSRNSDVNIDLHVVDPRGGVPKQLSANAGVNHGPTVSPDGRYIVFVSNRAGNSSIWRMDIDGSNPKQLTNSSEENPAFSPDGREIIFERQANKNTIWKVGIDGGEPVQLTDKESRWPVFSPDGKLFACFQREDPQSPYKLTIFPSNGGSPISTPSIGGPGSGPIRWMADGRSIAYIVNKGDVGNIWAQSIDGGTPKQITNFSAEAIQSFDLSRDGKQFALSRGTITRDVVLISGFRK